jgi:RES domain-containing protein
VKRDLKRLGPHTLTLEVSAFPRILRAAYAHQPKGLSSGPSRFSSSSGGFRVLYAAQDFATAFAEAVARDRFVDRQRRYIGKATLIGRAVTLITTTAPLKVLDARGEAAYILGVDTNAVRARAHDPGQALSERLHAETDFDGLLYDSRLTGRACIAVYERALPKIDASPAQPLLAHADLVPELQRMNIIVRKP